MRPTPNPIPSDPTSSEPPGSDLTAEELRVLACLVEKCHTTPDQYPLSTNALTAACNQKTSREPIVDYPANLVDRTLQLLRDGDWARSSRASGERTFKHHHLIDERLGLTVAEQAVWAVLALRGPQSPGELKTRTERYHPFADPAEVERVLGRLAAWDRPLVRNVGRAPGQGQDRWIQLLGPTDPAAGPPLAGPTGQAAEAPSDPAARGGELAASPPAAPAEGADRSGDAAEIGRLRDKVAAMEDRLARLERELGLDRG